MNITFVEIIVCVMMLACGITIIPALLNATNDLAVIVGVCCVIGCVFGVAKYKDNIINYINERN